MMNILTTLDILRSLNKLRQHEQWSPAQLGAYQTEQLRHLRDYAYQNSRFYQTFHKGLFDKPLHELPVLTKAMMMQNFNELVTDPAIHVSDVQSHVASDANNQQFLDRYWVTATSGSSGHPGFFLFNPTEWITIMASFARGQEWSGKTINLTHRTKMASVASRSAWHMSSQVSATAKSWFIPTLRLAASEPLPEIVRQLNDFKPEVLIAYASMARILADEQLAGRLRIEPRFVYVSSEVLTEETRHRAKNAWGDEPFNQYGCTEVANIAAEYWKDRRLYLYDDLIIIEVVDNDYQPVAPGVYGTKVLVTTLFSRTQPLIRYEVNDSVQLSSEVSTTLPFRQIQGIQGRQEDILYLPGITGTEIAVQPLVFTRVMDIVPASGWQLVQEADGLTVLVSGLPTAYADDRILNRLTEELTAQGVRIPRIQIHRVDAIPKSTAGKAPLIKAYHSAHQALPIS
jgi:phenylacetate-CoA ligase